MIFWRSEVFTKIDMLYDRFSEENLGKKTISILQLRKACRFLSWEKGFDMNLRKLSEVEAVFIGSLGL